MAFNPNELVFNKVRYVDLFDLSDGQVLARLTQVQDANLTVTSEVDEITDAEGTPITRLYRNKQAQFTAANALFSLDLAARQLGVDKNVIATTGKIPYEETITVSSNAAALTKTPAGTVKYVYVLEKNGIASTLASDTTASAGKFAIDGKNITTSGLTDGTKLYVEYEVNPEEGKAYKVSATSDSFPEAVGAKIAVYFKDVCDDSDVLGYIISNKAKLNPESVEIALTRDGTHSFTLDMFKDYCGTDQELFHIIVAQ